jgi:CRP/FNR family cyclic AMP-dependent transcriptional regulator
MGKPESPPEDLVSVLRTTKNRLAYLSQNDWALIIDKAKRVTFSKNQTLIQQGKKAKVVYLLAKGRVNIDVSRTRVAQIGPGEVCGEMAFLEDSLASATAIADEATETYAIEWPALESLSELFPHLASRFYRSLAVNLSRRLREQISSRQSQK